MSIKINNHIFELKSYYFDIRIKIPLCEHFVSILSLMYNGRLSQLAVVVIAAIVLYFVAFVYYCYYFHPINEWMLTKTKFFNLCANLIICIIE